MKMLTYLVVAAAALSLATASTGSPSTGGARMWRCANQGFGGCAPDVNGTLTEDECITTCHLADARAAAVGDPVLPHWASMPTTGSIPHHLVSFTEAERQAVLRAGAAGAIDWVARGAVTPATSQGRCATCAYFAGTAAVEGAWKLAGHPLVKLSEQEEIDCYNNGVYAMPNMVHGIARNADAPLANHSDPNLTGCRGVTDCNYTKTVPWAFINGTRSAVTHNDSDVLALLATGPAAVSIDARPYNIYHGGILNCSAEGPDHHVDHANTLVGYGIQAPPQKCKTQPANPSYTTYCDTEWILGSGGRDFFPRPEAKTLEQCCAACANEVGTPPSNPAEDTPRCGAANWINGECIMMATDATQYQLPGMANHVANVTSCVPFQRAPVPTKEVGFWIVKNSWGPGFGEKGFARLLFGNNCLRGVVQPYICPGPSCPPPTPPPTPASTVVA